MPRRLAPASSRTVTGWYSLILVPAWSFFESAFWPGFSSMKAYSAKLTWPCEPGRAAELIPGSLAASSWLIRPVWR